MQGTKEYKIVINGVSESIKQVDALNDAIQFLDSKIKELENRKVSVSSSSSSRNSGRTSELQTEDKLLKQIQKTEEQIANARREDYNSLLAQKDILKQVTDEAKERAAQERLVVSNYGNTMQGLKQELADIKSVMQSTELGTTQFDDLVQRADQLTKKLKEIEQSYGVFGRNVGNYPQSMGQDFQKLTISVNGVAREFNNAREALRTLTNERNTLKLMGEDVGDLDNVVKTLQSDIKDMATSSQAMDTMLDTMQGLVALGSTAEGFASIFGFDDNAIDETVKRLLALQNALQGIETIKKQMQTGEGVGGLITRGSAAIDTFTKRLFGLEKTTKAANTALASTSVAGKSAAGGLTTASAAATTATRSFSLATAAATALRVVLSALGIGLVIGAISLLVEGVGKLIDKQKEAKKYQEELNKAVEEGDQAYAKAEIELTSYQRKLNSFNGTKKEEKKLVEELNSKYGSALGTYKTVAEWQNILKERSAAYTRVLAKQAEAQALLNMYTEAYINLQKARESAEKGPSYGDNAAELWPWNWGGKTAQDKLDDRVKDAESKLQELRDKILKINEEIEETSKDNELFDYAPQIDKNGKKTAEAVRKVEDNIIKLRLELMKDGLTKTLLQMRAERDARIAEAKKSGIAVAEQEQLINKLYQQKEIEARKAHYKKLSDLAEKYNNEISKADSENQKKMMENLRQLNDNALFKSSSFENLSGGTDIKLDKLILDYGDLSKAIEKNNSVLRNLRAEYSMYIHDLDMYKKNLDDMAKSYNAVLTYDGGFVTQIEYSKGAIKELKDYADSYNEFVRLVQKSEQLISNNIITKSEERYYARREFYDKLLEASKEYYDRELELQKSSLDAEIKAEEAAERKRHSNIVGDNDFTKSLTARYSDVLYTADNGEIEKFVAEAKKELDKWLEEQDNALAKGEMSIKEYTKNTSSSLLESYRNNELDFEDYLDLMEQEYWTHENKMKLISENARANEERLENEHKSNMQQINSDYYSSLIQEVSLSVSSISRLRDKAEQKNAWGIINYKQTKENLKDLADSFTLTTARINDLQNDLAEKLRNNEISFADYDSSMAELKALENEANETSKAVQQDLKELGGKWWGSVDRWIQAVGQTMNQILGSMAEIQSSQYDKMIEEQEKYIDEYEKLLDKQRDITQQHASAVESIEDELSTARGDRRQQLIDQLNAEIAAQRASLAQEKKMEKEQEKAEERKKKLEHDQAEARKRMQLAQAMINAAMAVSMAAVNNWPIPAVPMMAMAAAAGAAQVAAIRAQHIPSYGSGGVIEGKSHRDGGVKAIVGNSPIELEGNEFIIRKKSTIPNLNLLDFVNRSEKKLSLEDLIDFYTSENGMRKRVISNNPKARYADGGQIPTLRNDINLSDRMLNAFEDYSKRPVVVSVVDIIDKSQNIREVQAMAGLETKY